MCMCVKQHDKINGRKIQLQLPLCTNAALILPLLHLTLSSIYHFNAIASFPLPSMSALCFCHFTGVVCWQPGRVVCSERQAVGLISCHSLFPSGYHPSPLRCCYARTIDFLLSFHFHLKCTQKSLHCRAARRQTVAQNRVIFYFSSLDEFSFFTNLLNIIFSNIRHSTV